jgi:hypothetical protein
MQWVAERWLREPALARRVVGAETQAASSKDGRRRLANDWHMRGGHGGRAKQTRFHKIATRDYKPHLIMANRTDPLQVFPLLCPMSLELHRSISHTACRCVTRLAAIRNFRGKRPQRPWVCVVVTR